MTYDPMRDTRAPADVNPNMRPHNHEHTGTGAGLLGLLALLLVGGFLYYAMSGERTVATNDSRPAATAPSTTGAGAGAPLDITPRTEPAAPAR